MKSAARSAENSKTFRTLARGGYIASGAVHALVGGIMLSIAFTGDGESDQSTALTEVASAPFGSAMIWLLALLLFALGLFQAVQGFTQSRGDNKAKWARRLSFWGQSAAYLSLGGVAISVALGQQSDGDDSAESASRGLLDVPGGPVILGIVGIGIAVGGIVYVVIGLRRGYEKHMRVPGGSLRKFVTVLGVTGYAAKGASIAVIGMLVTVAAVRNDPESAGALDSAISALRGLPGGVVIVAAMGLGFIAYAVFNAFRARYAKF